MHRFSLSDRQVAFLRAIYDGHMRSGYKALRFLDNRTPMGLLRRHYISVSSRWFALTRDGLDAYAAFVNGEPCFRKTESDLSPAIARMLHIDQHTFADNTITRSVTHEDQTDSRSLAATGAA